MLTTYGQKLCPFASAVGIRLTCLRSRSLSVRFRLGTIPTWELFLAFDVVPINKLRDANLQIHFLNHVHDSLPLI
jgi:hypothetical protein